VFTIREKCTSVKWDKKSLRILNADCMPQLLLQASSWFSSLLKEATSESHSLKAKEPTGVHDEMKHNCGGFRDKLARDLAEVRQFKPCHNTN